MTAATSRAAIEQEAREKLLELVKPGETVYTVLRHVSRSGMQRSISMFVFCNNEPLELDYWAGRLLNQRFDRDHAGLKIGGAGMDMGFAMVYNLSMAMFCPGKYDHDAAYSLKHRWL